MATVTPNFNWPVPTSTDLVKDGATAMEALGDAIDTSMVDLKGGTTGQILTKATNADMDFVWSTAAPGDITGVTAGTGISGGGTSGDVTITNSMATAIDAKGDLIAGTGADAFSRLAVGANDTVLTADSSTATGLKWATPASGGMTQIASTSLSGSSTTVSSIPATYKTLFIVINALSTDSNTQIEFYVNGTTSGYAYTGTTRIGTNSNFYSDVNDSRIRLSAGQSAAASATSSAYTLNFFNYTSTTALKLYNMIGFTGGSVDNIMIEQGGTWRNTAAITSCTVTTTGANFDGGTITVYGVN